MTQLPFPPQTPLIVFPCQIEYRRRIFINVAIDTGTSITIISEKAATEVGFDLTKLAEQTSFSDASQTHIVPLITLKSLCLGRATIENLQALCYTLPAEHGIDGVIGLNFLRPWPGRQFKRVILDFEQGLLILEKK